MTPFEDIFIDEDEVQHKGGDDEAPDRGGENEAPREGEGSGIPHIGGFDDEAPACEEFFEDPILVGADADTGPRGEQPQVVVHQAVTGGDDPPELCEYEQLRERNIRERDEAMKEAMEEIEEAKQDMRDNAPGAKRSAEGEEVGGRVQKTIQSS